MTMMQNNAGAGAAGQANPYGPVITNADKILSEIAEEDSISMISDKPRRLKPSDCVTPSDPMTNSFMGSIRGEKHNSTNTNTRLHESKGQIQSREIIVGGSSA